MGQLYRVRSGSILELIDDEGILSYGEIAPWPGLNAESLTMTDEQVRKINENISNLSLDTTLGVWDFLRKGMGDMTLLPSVHFGLESALLNLLSIRKSIWPAEWLFPVFHFLIPVNALLVDITDLEKRITTILEEGYHTLKVKVGVRSQSEEVATLMRIRQIDRDLRVRLDANRAWSLQEAVSFGFRIDPEMIEYIEEPCRNYRDLSEFHRQTGLPIALDESLNSVPNWFDDAPQGLCALILKPEVLGGITKTLQIARLANQKGWKVVMSNAFLSGIGLGMIAQLAAGLSDATTAAGLDTFKSFDEDIIEPAFAVQNGCVDLSQLPDQNITLKKQLLQRIF